MKVYGWQTQQKSEPATTSYRLLHDYVMSDLEVGECAEEGDCVKLFCKADVQRVTACSDVSPLHGGVSSFSFHSHQLAAEQLHL